MLRGRLEHLTALLVADPSLVDWRFPELDFGATGGRMLTLRGATLLHVAAEYGNLDASKLLLDRGAAVNARAAIHRQTPIFHAATQPNDAGLPTVRFLVERGADLSVRARVPGPCERPGETVECTPLGYALLFAGPECQTAAFRRKQGGIE